MFTKLCNQYLAELGLQDDLAYPQYPETFDALASLTHLSPQELANASIHCFARSPILSVVERSTGYLSDGTLFQFLSRSFRSKYLLHSARFCPDCLREAAYHHLAWMLKDVSGCLKHQCLLTERCQNCHSWVDIQDITRCKCGECRANLANVVTEPMEPFGLFAQKIIRRWWGMEVPTSSENETTETLPEHPPRVLYQLFERLENSIEASQSSREQFTQTVQAQHIVQSLALKALTNWPLGFYGFLRKELEWEVKVHSYYHYCDFSGPVYLRNESTLAFWICGSQNSPEFSFVQDAVEQFLAANRIEIESDRRGTRTCIHIRIEADESLQQIARPIAERAWERISAAVDAL
jgi:hypothetical protein